MNNIPVINRIHAYNHQRNALIDFDSYLKQVDPQDNRSLDEAVDNMKRLINDKMGLKLTSIVNTERYIINHHQMERAIAGGLKCYGMQGATAFDNEQLATTMLNAPVRDYRFKYFVAPKYQRLGNLNINNGRAVLDLWSQVLDGLIRHYGKKSYRNVVKS